MKLNAVGVTTSNLQKTVEFYTILGFKFPEHKKDESHLESLMPGSAKLMIDAKNVVKDIIGEQPKPGNHSSFALEYDSPKEVDDIVKQLKSNNHKVFKEPWDAFWGQRYAIVEDPDGYKVDLYASLS